MLMFIAYMYKAYMEALFFKNFFLFKKDLIIRQVQAYTLYRSTFSYYKKPRVFKMSSESEIRKL